MPLYVIDFPNVFLSGAPPIVGKHWSLKMFLIFKQQDTYLSISKQRINLKGTDQLKKNKIIHECKKTNNSQARQDSWHLSHL